MVDHGEKQQCWKQCTDMNFGNEWKNTSRRCSNRLASYLSRPTRQSHNQEKNTRERSISLPIPSANTYLAFCHKEDPMSALSASQPTISTFAGSYFGTASLIIPCISTHLGKEYKNRRCSA